ncbi:MAG TPA: ABC transporter permease [Fimbriimonadaceae bacterium]|nr:ABC transporter permease [Fimbriimonadaceae bacterium]
MIVWTRQMLVLIAKEFGQLLRDRTLLFFIVYLFTANVIMAGNDANRELKNARFMVFDADHSEASRDLVSRLRAPYFKYIGEVADPGEGHEALQTGRALIFIEIPPKFEQGLLRQDRPVQVQELVDTSKSTTGYLAASYSGSILARFAQDWASKARHVPSDPRIPSIANQARIWYNPKLEESWFSAIAELLMMLTVSCILLPASAMVREKERGTIEQLLVCPLSAVQITLAKALSMTFVMVVLTATCVYWILQGTFGMPIRGSLELFFALTVLYGFTSSGIGFLIATYSRNSAQAGMLVLLIVMPMILLSGTWTPLESMPQFVQWMTYLSPMRHFIDISFGILLRGAPFPSVLSSVIWMAGLGVALFAISLARFRKQFA